MKPMISMIVDTNIKWMKHLMFVKHMKQLGIVTAKIAAIAALIIFVLLIMRRIRKDIHLEETINVDEVLHAEVIDDEPYDEFIDIETEEAA